MSAHAFAANGLELELHDPQSLHLMRLFKRPGGDWDEVPPQYRNERVDPPDGYKDEFAVLYTADTLGTVAMECRILTCDPSDRYSWDAAKAAEVKVARYRLTQPAIFVPLDRNRHRFNLPAAAAYRREPYQKLSLELHRRFGTLIHGMSWASFHRGQPGRVFAIWHHHKEHIGLELDHSTPAVPLIDDLAWQALLFENPEFVRVDPAGADA